MAKEGGLNATYRMFKTSTFREHMKIPDQYWNKMEPIIKTKVKEIRQELCAQKCQKKENSAIINMVSALAKEETNEETIQVTSAFVVRSSIPEDPSERSQDKIYAIADGGADSCVLGKHAKVLSHTGRYASLVGYDPNTTKTDKVPIVTALIKAKSSSIGEHPVLLKVHEARYNPQSPTTLLSEYQMREHGIIIDSVAKKHKSVDGQQGTQCFQLNQSSYINFEDRGGLMSFEILPIEEGDEKRYDIITITSPIIWMPDSSHSTIVESMDIPNTVKSAEPMVNTLTLNANYYG